MNLVFRVRQNVQTKLWSTTTVPKMASAPTP